MGIFFFFGKCQDANTVKSLQDVELGNQPVATEGAYMVVQDSWSTTGLSSCGGDQPLREGPQLPFSL